MIGATSNFNLKFKVFINAHNLPLRAIDMRILLSFLCLLFFKITTAQVVYKESEYGFGVGGANYYGDLNQNQGFNTLRFGGSAFIKYNFNDYLSIKSSLAHILINGNDKFSANTFEKLRNLNFSNQITELSVQGEFNFLKYTIGDFDKRFTPYLTLGIGAFYHNPYTFYKGKKYYLKPLGTEGQNTTAFKARKYSNFGISLPTGIGVKFWLSKGITFGFEVLNRFTTNDYLDDVSTTYVGANNFAGPPGIENIDKVLQDRSLETGSLIPLGVEGRQRGITSNKDQFITGQITLSIRLQEYRCPRN